MKTALLAAALWLFSGSALALDAPTVQVDGQFLHWDAVPGATGYNVYRDDGTYVTSVKRTNYAVDIAGYPRGPAQAFYVVSTDQGDWRDWGRSETVEIEFPFRYVSTDYVPAGAVEGEVTGRFGSTVITRYDRRCTALLLGSSADFECSARCLNDETLIGGACAVFDDTPDDGETDTAYFGASATVDGAVYRCHAPDPDVFLAGVSISATALCASDLLD